ncbi:MAG: L-2-hydroxyglutarate oxidase [Verrucomicrobia bacterium]|nr:L-2-hydroxyglutarate oxidase [Verrucomicrobiota bacterium]
MTFDYLVVGGGLVGLATALRLQEKFRGARVVVLEKEEVAGIHQSTHNSGVLHCGLYYKPGSLKARLAVRGIQQMVEFCRQHEVPHEICGKVVVATEESEIPRLEELLRRGQANGLTGLRRLDVAGLRAIEPHAAGIAAAHVPQEGIVDYAAVIRAMERLIGARDGKVLTRARVTGMRLAGNWRVASEAGEYEAKFIVNCAGLHCDRVSRLAGENEDVRIVPFRGEYYELRPAAAGLVRHLIYPVPDPAFPFLGVHFTRMIKGGVECGPNAVLAFAREGYRASNVNARDLAEVLVYPGLWRFLRRYPQMAVSELVRSFSQERFCRSLQRLVPEVTTSDLIRGTAGVRAQAMNSSGDLLQDFHLVKRERALHVLNAPSPAATASLAIAEHVVDQIAA